MPESTMMPSAAAGAIWQREVKCVCLTILASLCFAVSGFGQQCTTLPSVQNSAILAVNSVAGGHVLKHITGAIPPPLYMQAYATMFSDAGQYTTIWNSYVAKGSVAICSPGQPNGATVSENVPVAALQADDTLQSCQCGSDATVNGSCRQGYYNVSSTITFVFKVVNGQWALLTAYPQYGMPTANVCVNQAASSTGVSSSLNPASSGRSVVFTATVTPNPSGTPTGAVQFMDGAGTLGAPVTLSGGIASVNTSALSTGAHTISAIYTGDPEFASSISPQLTQMIMTTNGTGTTTALAPSAATTFFHQAVKLSVQVSPKTGPAMPTGSVVLFEGSTPLGPPLQLDGNGRTAATLPLPIGTNRIQAVYSGDANSSGSASLVQIVNASPRPRPR